MFRKRSFFLLVLSFLLSANTVFAQVPEPIQQKDSLEVAGYIAEEQLLPDQEKRQEKKTGIMVLVSCLLIVTTTIILYNVRSE